MKTLIMIAGLLTIQVAMPACRTAQEKLSPPEYIQWVESVENGLRTSKTIEGYTFDLQFKPAEYVVLREEMIQPSSETEMLTEMNTLSGMQYFTLRISKDGRKDLLTDDALSTDAYSSRLVYFTSMMQNDICLVEDGDTLPCILFHFERTYSIDPRSTFLVGFPVRENEKEVSDKTFVLYDKELGTGPIILSINRHNLSSIPSLKLN